jgi:UDP-N-acetylglucosamine 2-epimerase
MKIITIVGARPQFIKAAVVSRAIINHNAVNGNDPDRIKEIIVHTGQHYDHNMSDIFFEEMQIPEPNYFLNINGLTHGAMTGQMLEKIEAVLVDEKPDVVLVYGDTNTTLAGALAAVKLHIPVAHVEAGLRSFNRRMPEEINRVLTDHVASFLFCPTQQAVDNLKDEGIGRGSSSAHKPVSSSSKEVECDPVQKIEDSSTNEFMNLRGNLFSLSPITHDLMPIVVMVGDVMYDSVLFNLKIAETKSKIIEKLNLKSKAYALATVHRAENTDDSHRLQAIFEALGKISAEGLGVVLPLHPRTRKLLDASRLSDTKINIIEPVSYLDMLELEQQAQLILTDSGGVQKEAYWMKVPCITLRDETEWIETIETGWNILAGADRDKIIESATDDRRPSTQYPAYGDGKAGEKIVDILGQPGFYRENQKCST